jgi:hypothetical protein
VADPILAPLFLAAGIAVAPVAAVIGAGVGLVKGNDSETIAAASDALRNALVELRPAEAVAADMIAQAKFFGRDLVDCQASKIATACPMVNGSPVATLVRLQAEPPWFEIEGKIDPSLRLLLRVDATVLHGDVTKPAYLRGWIYRGTLTDYFDLARNDAAVFRAEMATAAQAIAAKAASDLLTGGAEVHSTPAQPEGSVWTVLTVDAPTVGTVDPAGIPLTDGSTSPATSAAPAASGPPG